MNRRIRVLLTISEFTYSSQLRNLCDLLSSLDTSVFEPEVAALSMGDAGAREVSRLGFPIYQLRLQPSRRLTWKTTKELLSGPFRVFNRRYDVVHSLLYQSVCTEPLLFKLLSRTKYVYTKSNLEWDNHRLNWTWKSRLADRVVSISTATQALLESNGFERKAVSIPLGIDTQAFRESLRQRDEFRATYCIPAHAFVFGCAAQFIPLKEHHTLVEGFEQVARDDPRCVLVLCGQDHRDGYYASVRERIERSPYASRIRLLGNLADMPPFYSAIDCFVLVSRFEAFGYVYVEAMSCSRPVIACRAAGGPSDIVDDEVTGILVPISSPEGLAGAMRRYLEKPALVTEHGAAARKRAVSSFSRELMAQRCGELYESLGSEA